MTRKDKIGNEHVRGTPRLPQASKRFTEKILNRYWHVKRRDEEHILRNVLRMGLQGKRKRRRPNTRWKDACQGDLKHPWTESGQGDGQGDME